MITRTYTYTRADVIIGMALAAFLSIVVMTEVYRDKCGCERIDAPREMTR